VKRQRGSSSGDEPTATPHEHYRKPDTHTHTLERSCRQTFHFCYLGRTITSRDIDWQAARKNLQKAKTRWTTIARVLTRNGASPRISAMFYKATIQTVLLYGSETWVITDEILQLLTSFHHSVARRLTGRHDPRPSDDNNDKWIYPSIKETLRIAGLHPIEEYLRQRRRYLELHARTLPILQECQNALITERPSRPTHWWNQSLANTH
jgi:hypothetical protein